ncbi:14285_t:CDS:2 [Funneliformis geosporum]|uniref:14285_t:CDS:1 n=1 Tax=Funneliformis geosporum TaxID=1117311 RepID=A0A9W4WIF9_9GLOM|nr:14285_t:CDS:2 [Funneliformis geosporum]
MKQDLLSISLSLIMAEYLAYDLKEVLIKEDEIGVEGSEMQIINS